LQHITGILTREQQPPAAIQVIFDSLLIRAVQNRELSLPVYQMA
jgi:hypothetical protein